MKIPLERALAEEAKALVALAVRNGPIEDLHAGTACPHCTGRPDISHISDPEMKTIMKSAVDALYRLLWLRDNDPAAYEQSITYGRRFTHLWDDPDLNTNKRVGRPDK